MMGHPCLAEVLPEHKSSSYGNVRSATYDHSNGSNLYFRGGMEYTPRCDFAVQGIPQITDSLVQVAAELSKRQVFVHQCGDTWAIGSASAVVFSPVRAGLTWHTIASA